MRRLFSSRSAGVFISVIPFKSGGSLVVSSSAIVEDRVYARNGNERLPLRPAVTICSDRLIFMTAALFR